MAINPDLLVIKPVSQLTEVTGLQDGDLLFYDGSGNLKRISIDTFNNLSKTAKPLKPTDATPTEEGLYMPTESGTYANAGGLIAQEGYYTLFFFDGTNWTKSESELPGDSTSDLNLILKTFLEPSNPIDREILTSDTNTFANVYGVNDQLGILKPDNTISYTPEPGVHTNTWLNIPSKANGIKKIDLKIRPYGNAPSAVSNINLIGVKAGVFTNLVFYDQGGAPSTLQEYSIDISEYDTVSLSLYRLDSVANTFQQEVKFYKEIGATVEEDAVKKYIDAKIVGGSGYDYLDLIDFGAVGDGVADDTAKFNSAIIQVISNGGGYVFGRDKKFKVSSIEIPDVQKWCRVGICGSLPPVPRFGTIGDFDVTTYNGMEIISALNDAGKGIINVNSGSAYEGFNMVMLDVERLTVRAYNNPQCHGINATNAVQLNIRDVVVDTGRYNVHASLPTAITAGVLTPKLGNGAWSRLTNLVVSGFYSGAYIYEHVLGDYVVLASNKIGLRFYKANHSSLFTRAGFYRNQKDVVVEDFHRFNIEQMAIELVGAGQFDSNNAWQQSIANLEDVGNKGSGKISFDTCLGGVGPVNTFVKNGGTGVICTQL